MTSPSLQPAELTTRDKRYLSQVERALGSFDALEEWADYIAFLGRLNKTLALPSEKGTTLWVPLAEQVLRHLSLCLSPQLPNGVHQKTLELYEEILEALTDDALNKDIFIWIPGLLPVLSYGSMQVKPKLLSLFQNVLLKRLHSSTLKALTKPLVLFYLSGLDDPNSEIFDDVLKLTDSFKSKLADNSHFWQSLFICIISSPEKRIGGLNWCTNRLPNLWRISTGDQALFSAEAQACLSPEPGLLARAFAAAVATQSGFNQATDIIVIRGYFDLLLAKIPLNSPVITDVISNDDKKILIMACCKVTLRKDMSLNRRLWNWLLGPDSPEDTEANQRKDFFSTHALSTIAGGIKTSLAKNSLQQQLEAYKISLALIMDRWEISCSLTPEIFVHLMQSCKTFVSHNDAPEVISAARNFFDEVESEFIWKFIICDLILPGDEKNLSMLEFVLKTFQFPEEERMAHAPFAILCFLYKFDANENTVSLLDLMLEVAQVTQIPKSLTDVDFPVPSIQQEIGKIKQFYLNAFNESVNETSESTSDRPQITHQELTFLLLETLQSWYLRSLKDASYSEAIAVLFSDFLYAMPQTSVPKAWGGDSLIQAILQFPEFATNNLGQSVSNASAVFGIVRFARFVMENLDIEQQGTLLRILVSNFWAMLSSLFPANHQVEACRCIFDLQACFDGHEIEAALIQMLQDTPFSMRSQVFYKLWSHSSSLSSAERILSGPLFIMLDSSRDSSSPESLMEFLKLVQSIITDGSANCLLRIITNPLCGFSFVRNVNPVLSDEDDLKLFAYHLETIINVVKSNEKLLKDSLNHEFVSSESAEKQELFTANKWSISSYKSLLLRLAEKVICLKIEKSHKLQSYIRCVASALDLYARLLTGSEAHFEQCFEILIDACSYLIGNFESNIYEIEIVLSLYIDKITEILAMGKAMNIHLIFLKLDESNELMLIDLIIRGIASSGSPILLERWFQLLHTTLYLLNEGIFLEVLTFNGTIIDKIESLMSPIHKLTLSDASKDLEACVCLCLSALEDLLSVTHSYLVTSEISPATKNQQPENGFLGNVISGVFLIESPLMKTEKEERVSSTVIAFQDSAKAAFKIWSWADARPDDNTLHSLASRKSTGHVLSKLKFRSRKLLESLCDLERQEVLEALLESDGQVSTKIKAFHVLDSGRPQLSLSNLYNSILTRCSPQTLGEKERSAMFSEVNEKQLSQFLIPYIRSIDLDSLNDVLDPTFNFMKEVSLHPMNFKTSLVCYLNVIQILSEKVHSRNFNDTRGASKELLGYFMSIIAAATSKKAKTVPNGEADTTTEDEDLNLTSNLCGLIEHLGTVLQENDKITTAITTIISTVILSRTKSKSKKIDASVVQLIEAIGLHYPIKAWRHLVGDIFMSNTFLANTCEEPLAWRSIIGVWIANEKEKMSDLIARVTPSIQPSAANIFIWNESSEVEDRVSVLKRITHLIMAGSTDAFGKELSELMAKISGLSSSACPPTYLSAAFTLFRAMTLKFSEPHLLPFWPVITQSLAKYFSETSSKSSKELSVLDQDQLSLLLSACKLLDQFLLIGFDDFNLSSWLFITDGSGIESSRGNAYIDIMAAKTEALLTRDNLVAVAGPQQSHSLVKPLLTGIKCINNVASLKRFFGLMSYINFERSYGLCEPDLSACETDVYNDLS